MEFAPILWATKDRSLTKAQEDRLKTVFYRDLRAVPLLTIPARIYKLRPPLAIAEAAPAGVSAGWLPRAERAGDVLPRFGVPLRRLMAGAARETAAAPLRVPIIASYCSIRVQSVRGHFGKTRP
eukprot:COSAG06_NODE_15319_length_1080_cov_5.837920_2_plen_124_part_00